MGWLNKTLGKIGKWIPNEFSKSNSWAKYVPYVGWLSQAVGGVDAAATAYDDVGDRGGNEYDKWSKLFEGGMAGYSGSDPGRYGSPNVNRDAWNMIGQIIPSIMDFQNIGQNSYLFKGDGGRNNKYYFNKDKPHIQQEIAKDRASAGPNMGNLFGGLLGSGDKASMAMSSPFGKAIAKDPELSQDAAREIMIQTIKLYSSQPKDADKQLTYNEVLSLLQDNLIKGPKAGATMPMAGGTAK